MKPGDRVRLLPSCSVLTDEWAAECGWVAGMEGTVITAEEAWAEELAYRMPLHPEDYDANGFINNFTPERVQVRWDDWPQANDYPVGEVDHYELELISPGPRWVGDWESPPQTDSAIPTGDST